MLSQLTRILGMSEDEIRRHPFLMVCVFDHDHRVLFWNQRCETYLGISEKEAVGRTVEDLIPYTREHSKTVRLDEALSGKDVYITDDQFVTLPNYYSQVLLPIKNTSGKVVAAVSIVRPVVSP